MSFLGSSRGRSKKGSSKGDLLGFDLLYQLAYLSAVAAAGIPRSQIFRRASKLPCATAGYFHEVDRLAQSMNYQYAEACRLVGESSKQQEIKSLLFRMSSSLSSGELATDFMNREARIQAEAYGNDYERKLESLKKWTDAYVALLVSVALIIVVAAISTVIYDMGTGFVAGLAGVMISISGLGSWVIYRTSPREVKTLSSAEGYNSQRLPRTLLLSLVPGALVISALLLIAGVSVGWVLVAAGAMVLPIGIAGWRLDNSVSKYDDDVSGFIRALGATASAIGTTPVEALGRMDLRSIGSLAPAVKQLYILPRSRINPDLCWRRFVAGTGSELVNRGVRVFMDGVNLGGDAEEVGSRASLLTMKVNFLRAKRKLVSTTFAWLSLIMHATVVFLLVFILDIVGGFAKVVEAAGVAGLASGEGAAMGSILSFNFQNLEFLRWLIVPVIIVLSVINAVTPKVADGGYSHKFFFYLGATLFTAGVSLVAAPKLASIIFGLAPVA